MVTPDTDATLGPSHLFESWHERQARRAAKRKASIARAAEETRLAYLRAALPVPPSLIAAAPAPAVEQRHRQAAWSKAHKSRSEALAAGEPRYWGRPCKHGHPGLRFSNHGGCCQCSTEGAERRRREAGKRLRGPRPQARHPLRSKRREAARQRRAVSVNRLGGISRVSRKRTQIRSYVMSGAPNRSKTNIGPVRVK